MIIKTKKVLVIIGGGISAYKSLDLIRRLKKNNFEIKTILTKSGKEFVTPLSITALSGHKPYENLFDVSRETEIDHISLSRWADLIIVLPTTANFMSRLCQGKADDLSTTVILASNKDVMLVPAMNVRMWINPATQENYKTLVGYGYKFIGPIKGKMACGEFGEGKMSNSNQIFQEIQNYFKNTSNIKKQGLKALVTTGPTREYLDPVRFISNESSGVQGYEIAKLLSKSGVKTTLIAGPSDLNSVLGLKIIKVKTAKEMLNEVKKLLPVDIAVCAAAVSDFKPKDFNPSKIKKNKKTLKSLELDKNIDILDYLGKHNRNRPKLVVGFSAETENLIKNSEEKLREKRCDIIVANDVSKKDFGFNSQYNKVSLIENDGKILNIKKSKKKFIAAAITKKILQKFLLIDEYIN